VCCLAQVIELIFPPWKIAYTVSSLSVASKDLSEGQAPAHDGWPYAEK
jgi:hypothetical protein